MPTYTAKNDYEKTIPVNSQVEVVVETFNGAIEVTPCDSLGIELVAHVKAYGYSQEEADSALDGLIPEIDTSTSSVSIRSRKPSSRMFSADSVSMEVKVPAGWPLRLTTSNGAIKSEGSKAAVVASTSNGAIEVTQGEGPLQLDTSNGRITIHNSTGKIGAKTSNGRIEATDCVFEGESSLTTSNGAIEFTLHQPSKVRLDAFTSNGTIQCDGLNFSVTDKSKKHFLGEWLGVPNTHPDSVKLDVATSNGSVKIKSKVLQENSQPQLQ